MPLRRRDKQLLGALCVVLIAGATAAGALSHGETHGKHCLVVDIPSTVGGAHLTRCGADAVRFCRAESRSDAIVAAACRKQGIAAVGRVR